MIVDTFKKINCYIPISKWTLKNKNNLQSYFDGSIKMRQNYLNKEDKCEKYLWIGLNSKKY